MPFLLLLFFSQASLLLAETVPPPSDSVRPSYDFVSGGVLFKVRHPFKTVLVGSQELTATMAIDLKDLQKTFKLEVHLPIQTLQVRPIFLQNKLREWLGGTDFPEATFQSLHIRSVSFNDPQNPQFEMVGNLKIRNTVTSPLVHMECSRPGPTDMDCQYRTEILLDDYIASAPKLLAVGPDNRIAVEGHLAFTQKGKP